jgi:hypothetical protein
MLAVMPGHHARFRRQPRVWLDDEHWSAEAGLHEDVLELTCRACGDTLGPFEKQAAEIQVLRGPYAGVVEANAAAQRHLLDTTQRE